MSSNGPSGSPGAQFDFSDPYGGYGGGGYGTTGGGSVGVSAPGTGSPGGGPADPGRDLGPKGRPPKEPPKKKLEPGDEGYELTEEGKAAIAEKKAEEKRKSRSLLTGYTPPSVKRRELSGFGTEESTQLY